MANLSHPTATVTGVPHLVPRFVPRLVSTWGVGVEEGHPHLNDSKQVALCSLLGVILRLCNVMLHQTADLFGEAFSSFFLMCRDRPRCIERAYEGMRGLFWPTASAEEKAPDWPPPPVPMTCRVPHCGQTMLPKVYAWGKYWCARCSCSGFKKDGTIRRDHEAFQILGSAM